MKLLFVHDQFGARGGAESNIFDTATELKKRGHEVAILHGARTGQREASWEKLFIDRFSLAVGGSDQSAILSFQPDVIYVHKLADLEVLETLVTSGVPLTRLVHDHDIYCMRGYKYNPLTRNICTRAASPYCLFPCGAAVARNRASGLPLKWVSYTDKQRELRLNRRFQRMFVYSHYMQTELIRNGFDPLRVKVLSPLQEPLKETASGSFSDRNLIIFSGQIIRGKGVDVLLESLAGVTPPFECHIFGEGSHRRSCEELSRKLGLGDRVHFRGFVGSDELARYYQEASLAVVSSVWPEPFGLVGPEAMRHGLPVVAFDVGGISEWLLDGVNGFLVPRMDCAAFAARVQQLLGDKPLARQMGQRGSQMARQKHDPSTQIAILENAFANLMPETEGALKV